MSNLKTLAIGATMALACIGAFAQAASAPATPRVDKREVRQEKRIEQGVASGQLTARETRKLGREQTAIQKTEAKAKSDGQVTKSERKRLTRMQNRASQDIYQQKHDAQTATKP
jgi:DNA repair exonuclease SbcCD nuclease subunit